MALLLENKETDTVAFAHSQSQTSLGEASVGGHFVPMLVAAETVAFAYSRILHKAAPMIEN